jgi:signal transduction histidine kinase/ligand-binding sensor domain-containing protein
MSFFPLTLAAQIYRFKYYSHTDGLKNTEVHCLLQDHTGFLWVGTSTGLFRYDGLQFTEYIEPNHATSFIEALSEAPDGTLWVGTREGLARLRDNRLEFVDPPGWVRITGQSSLAFDSLGWLYVATGNGLYVGHPGVRDISFQRYANPGEIGDPEVHSVHIDPSGAVWLGCGNKLCSLASGGIRVAASDAELPPDRWDAILTDREGNLWVRSVHRLLMRPGGGRSFLARDQGLGSSTDTASLYLDREGRLFAPTELGLGRQTPDGWETIGIRRGLPTDPTCCVLQDREGSIWVGLAGAGLARWLGYGQWQSWTGSEGLAGSNVQAIHRDGAGVLWIGTEGGIQRLGPDGNISRAWTETDGLGGTKVRAVASSADGGIWIGNSPGGVSRLDPRSGKIRRYQLGSETEVNVTGMAIDREQRLWVTTQDALFRSTPLDQSVQFDRQILPLSGPGEVFNQVLIDSKGRWWFAGSAGLLRMENGQWKRFTARDGLRNDDLSTLAETPDGGIWVGYTGDLGVSRLSFDQGNPQWRHFSERDGLKSDEIDALQTDARGWLWVGSNDGADAFDGKNWHHYSQENGLLWDDCVGRSLFADLDGSMWIGTSRGLSRFRPPVREAPKIAPPVVITSIQFGDGPANPFPRPVVPYRDHSLVVGFAGLSFVDERSVRFRYRLKGLEENWVETNQREARYPSLPSGRYAFEVLTSSPEGVWSKEPAAFAFRILPPWWKSWWARSLAVALLLLVVRLIWSWRVAHLEREKRRLEVAVERRTRELELEKANVLVQKIRAEEASRLKSEFLANMSHEIRTPMNGILGMAELALEATSPDEQHEYLRDMTTSAQLLLHILNDILDVSKIEAGRMDIEQVPFSVQQCTNDAGRTLSLSATQKGLELRREFAPGIPHLLLGDPVRLRQVLLNLISNAVKFTETGWIAVETAVESADEKGLVLHFTVADSGPGIPADKQQLIFEAFRQVDGSTTRRFGGTGLGLTISARLVELMGGRIWVESEVGHGSIFHFTARFRRTPEPDSIAAVEEAGKTLSLPA